MKNKNLEQAKKPKNFLAHKAAVLTLSGCLLLAGGGIFCATLLAPEQPGSAFIDDDAVAMSDINGAFSPDVDSPANETVTNANDVSASDVDDAENTNIVDADLAMVDEDGNVTLNLNTNVADDSDAVSSDAEAKTEVETQITQVAPTTDTGEVIEDTLSSGLGDAEEIINVEIPAA